MFWVTLGGWIFAGLLFLAGSAAQATEAQPLRFCYYNFEIKPYYIGNGETVPPRGDRGIVIEMIHDVADQVGLQIEWIRRPWKRCLLMVEKGDADGLTFALPTAEREKFLAFPRTETGVIDTEQSIGLSKYYFYTNIYNPLEWDGRVFDRPRVRIGVLPGLVATEKIKEMGFGFVQESGSIEGLQKVLDRELDAFVLGDASAQHLIKQLNNGSFRLKKIDPPVYIGYGYHSVSLDYYADHKELVDAFWAEVSKRSWDFLRKNNLLGQNETKG